MKLWLWSCGCESCEAVAFKLWLCSSICEAVAVRLWSRSFGCEVVTLKLWLYKLYLWICDNGDVAVELWL